MTQSNEELRCWCGHPKSEHKDDRCVSCAVNGDPGHEFEAIEPLDGGGAIIG